MKSLLEERLLDELRLRNHRLFIPHCGILLITLFLFYDFHSDRLLSYFPYVLIALALYLRYFIMQFFFESYKAGNFFIRTSYIVLVATTALGWGLLCSDAMSIKGILSIEALYFLGIILTNLSGGITAFSPSLTLASVFMSSSVVVPVVLLIKQDSPMNILGYFLVVNCGYQIYHAAITNKYLRRTMKNEIDAKIQKDVLQEYIDAIPGIVGVVDRNATYTMVNNFMEGKIKKAILGTKVGATLKNNPISLLILEFLDNEETHCAREIYAEDLAGKNWYMVNLKKISSPYDGVLVAILPINDLVKAKNDLKIQEARSQYAAKLASIGEFSAGIAHEVNNPLTIIEGAANQLRDILRENPNDHEMLSHVSRKISDTTQRVGKIVKGLKTLAKNEEEEPFTNLPFISIVEPAREITKLKIQEHGIQLRIFNHQEEIALFGNEIQLGQVILNLISNSIDAVKDLPEKWIEIHYRPSFEWSDIIVVDSGKGIPEKIQEKIMKPFFTTKRSPHGTGLGLSISKSIIDKHFGKLEVMTDAENTTFQIRLPRMNPWKEKDFGVTGNPSLPLQDDKV